APPPRTAIASAFGDPHEDHGDRFRYCAKSGSGDHEVAARKQGSGHAPLRRLRVAAKPRAPRGISMPTPPPDPNQVLFDAIAFAAWAHRHQIRKDNRTPYVSHVFRVCLVVRHVFGFDDPQMLAAAILHDTIEDTTTDCDDIIERFGPDVARWVAALTKDMRLPNDQREDAYAKTLAAADWQGKGLKLADIYDNTADWKHPPLAGRPKAPP